MPQNIVRNSLLRFPSRFLYSRHQILSCCLEADATARYKISIALLAAMLTQFNRHDPLLYGIYIDVIWCICITVNLMVCINAVFNMEIDFFPSGVLDLISPYD